MASSNSPFPACLPCSPLRKRLTAQREECDRLASEAEQARRRRDDYNTKAETFKKKRRRKRARKKAAPTTRLPLVSARAKALNSELTRLLKRLRSSEWEELELSREREAVRRQIGEAREHLRLDKELELAKGETKLLEQNALERVRPLPELESLSESALNRRRAVVRELFGVEERLRQRQEDKMDKKKQMRNTERLHSSPPEKKIYCKPVNEQKSSHRKPENEQTEKTFNPVSFDDVFARRRRVHERMSALGSEMRALREALLAPTEDEEWIGERIVAEELVNEAVRRGEIMKVVGRLVVVKEE